MHDHDREHHELLRLWCLSLFLLGSSLFHVANVELTGAARLYRAASVLSAMLGIIFFSPIFFPFDSNLIKTLAVPIKKLPKISIEKVVDGFDVL